SLHDSLPIWSHPCSTGEEPYSIAMWLLENWPEVDSHEIEIVGSDIDTRVLDEARGGVYGRRALMRLTPELVAKYFVQESDDQWRVAQGLRDSIEFSRANLVEPTG